MTLTLEQYQTAKKLVDTHCVCSEPRCQKVFEMGSEGGKTIYYGQINYWCGEHYFHANEEVKDCMRG